MSAALLAAVSAMAAFGAAWELLETRDGVTRSARRRLAEVLGVGGTTLSAAATRLALPERIAAAGLAGRLSTRVVLVLKAIGAATGATMASAAAPAAPGRLSVVVAIALPVAGFLGPDALLERMARRRRAAIDAALPDALDVLAVSVASGRDAAAAVSALAAAAPGPLGSELSVVATDIAHGAPAAVALEGLRDRIGGAAIAAFVSSLKRSRAHGSPLADQLASQASALRRDQRRRIEEGAAKAAPKIQLVVALVLVPSVLLMIAAGLISNSGALLTGL